MNEKSRKALEAFHEWVESKGGWDKVQVVKVEYEEQEHEGVILERVNLQIEHEDKK